jgi:HTH-type transcriptional regulator, competence development regulator
MTFGERLRQLRLDKKVNQRDLASRVGIDFTYLSKLENGRMPPPATATIARLAKALGADNDELMLLARKVPIDIAPVITRSPAVPAFLRSIKDFDDVEIGKLTDYAQKMKSQRK